MGILSYIIAIFAFGEKRPSVNLVQLGNRNRSEPAVLFNRGVGIFFAQKTRK